MTPINASSNGYNTTLSVCREHLNDAYSAIISARDMLSAFCEAYVDVDDETFIRRAVVSHAQFANAFSIAMTAMVDTGSLISTARALTFGADMIAADCNDSNDSDKEEL